VDDQERGAGGFLGRGEHVEEHRFVDRLARQVGQDDQLSRFEERLPVLREEGLHGVFAEALPRQASRVGVEGELAVGRVGWFQRLREGELDRRPFDRGPLLAGVLGEPGGRGDVERAGLGDAIAQPEVPQHLRERIAGRDPGRLQGHLPAQVDLRLGDRAVVQLIAEPGLTRDQVEDLLGGRLLDGHGDGPVEHLVHARANVRVPLGRQRRDFLVVFLLRSLRLPEDRLGLLGSGLLLRGLLVLVLLLFRRRILLGGRRGEFVEPADAITVLGRGDHGDVEEPAAGQVLQGVLIGASPDLQRDREGQLGVVGDEAFESGSILEEEGGFGRAKPLEPVAFRQVALRDPGRRIGDQVRLEPLQTTSAIRPRRPMGEERAFLRPELDVDIFLGLAEELHHGDWRDRELARQFGAFELRPARADVAGHGVPGNARRVHGRLGRVADPDRPLLDLDPGRRPLVGPSRRGPGAEAERGRQTARSDR